MLINKSDFCSGLPFFFFFSSFSSFVGVEKEGSSLETPQTPPSPRILAGFISPHTASATSGSGREETGGPTGSVLMNSFHTACSLNHPLLRPGAGTRAPDVLGGMRRGGGRWRRALELSQHPPLSPPGPFGWIRTWSGIKTSRGSLG